MKTNLNVSLIAINSKYVHNNIAIYYLKNSLLNNYNNSNNKINITTLQLSVNDDFNNLLNTIIDTNPDVICLGVYVWNCNIIFDLCNILKQLLPNLIIALGGPEVSYNYMEVLNKHNYIDSILVLESENSIIDLVDDVFKSCTKPYYIHDVDILNLPCISDELILNCCNKPIYFETSRGCPYRCSYCTSCIDKRVRYRNLDIVTAELKKLLDAKVKQIRFLDRTFNSNKKRAITIWKFLIENNICSEFHFEICANLIDEETLKFLQTVPKDIFRFEIGIQSTNDKTLKAINRTNNFEKETHIIQKLVSLNNIFLHTDLIIGLPYEDINTFKTSFNNLYNLKTNEMQLGFLKFLKGTDIYLDKEKYGYVYNTKPPYEIISNNFLSFKDVTFLKTFESVFEVLYNSSKFKYTVKYLEENFTIPYDIYETISKYIISNNITNTTIENINEIILNIFENDIILKQILTYDYFLNNKGIKKWMYINNNYDLTLEINNYIQKTLNIPYSNHSEYFKAYKSNRFLVLDYDIYNNKNIKTIYMIKN